MRKEEGSERRILTEARAVAVAVEVLPVKHWLTGWEEAMAWAKADALAPPPPACADA